MDGGWNLKLAVPDLGGDCHGAGQFREGEPVPAVCTQGRGEQSLVGTHCDGVCLHILTADIDRCSQGKTQPLPLSTGIACSTLVLSHHLARKIQKIAFRIGPAGILLKKRCIISAGNKADILAVPLPGVDQSLGFCNFPDLCLGQCAQGEETVGKLRLV